MAPNDASALLDYSPRPENARLVREEPEVEHIISHNLNDIYLLLDHLSGRADSSVAGIEVDYEGHKQNIVDAVCKIGWLARKGQAQWEEAAVLFKARDKLNQRSAPATGLTIAYTLLVAPIPITNGFLRLFSFLRRRDYEEGYPHSIARKAYPHPNLLCDSLQKMDRSPPTNNVPRFGPDEFIVVVRRLWQIYLATN